ncbi:hypothetical protein B2J88_52245 [Rhodococcus sp. SRB_17]|nr:hypothetical protein [Rhodococcus sp. SRB_17]
MHPRALRTRDGIVEAAASQFNTIGYAATTVNDIVERSASTKGSMYFHFPSKKSLAQHLVQVWDELLVDTVARATTSGEPPNQQIATIYRKLARHVAQDHKVRAGLLLSLDQGVDESMKVYRGWAGAVTVIAEQAVAAGDLDTAGTPTRIAEGLCAGFVGAVHIASSLGKPKTISRRVDDLLLMWRGTDSATARKVEAANR